MREPARQKVPEESFLVGELRELEEAVLQPAEEVSPLSAESRVFVGFVLFCVYARARFSDAAKVRSEPFLDLHEGEGFVRGLNHRRTDEVRPDCQESAAHSSSRRPSQGFRRRNLG